MSRIKGNNVQLGNSYLIGRTVNENKTDIFEQEAAKKDKEQARTVLNEANNEALKIIAQAQHEAQQLIDKAVELQKKLQEEGFQTGIQTGYEEGINKAINDLSNQLKSVDILAEASFDIKKEIITSSEQEVLQLSIVIAEKIIKQQLEIAPEIMLNIVKAAINELKDKEEVRVLVNPLLTKHLYEFSDELKQAVKGLKTVKIVEDKTIPTDGFFVESPESRIDARLSTQIAEITRNIMIEASLNPALDEIPKEIEIRIQEPPVMEG